MKPFPIYNVGDTMQLDNSTYQVIAVTPFNNDWIYTLYSPYVEQPYTACSEKEIVSHIAHVAKWQTQQT